MYNYYYHSNYHYYYYIVIIIVHIRHNQSQSPESWVAEAQLLCAMKEGAIFLQCLIHINDPVRVARGNAGNAWECLKNWVKGFGIQKDVIHLYCLIISSLVYP